MIPSALPGYTSSIETIITRDLNSKNSSQFLGLDGIRSTAAIYTYGRYEDTSVTSKSEYEKRDRSFIPVLEVHRKREAAVNKKSLLG